MSHDCDNEQGTQARRHKLEKKPVKRADGWKNVDEDQGRRRNKEEGTKCDKKKSREKKKSENVCVVSGTVCVCVCVVVIMSRCGVCG